MCANQHTPKHAATQPLHGSTARARAPNLVTSKELGGSDRIGVGAPTASCTPTRVVLVEYECVWQEVQSAFSVDLDAGHARSANCILMQRKCT